MDAPLSRRHVLRLAAAAAGGLAVARDPRAAAHGSHGGGPPDGAHRVPDWPLPAHDLAATRHVRARPRGWEERWRATLAGGVPGAAALVRGRAIAASLGGEVAAFGLGRGGERWRRAFGTATYGSGADARELGFFGGVAVRGRRVVVASDRVRALDLGDGSTCWEAPPLRAPGGDDYFWGAPVIAEGRVLVGSGAGTELPVARGRITAYALADGRRLWSTATVPEGANGGGVLAPVTVDPVRGSVYAATGSPYAPLPGANPGTSSLLELSLRSGRVRWSDQVHAGGGGGLDLNSAPLLLGRLVVVAGKDGFRAWDRVARRRLWHVQLTPSAPPDGGPAGPTDGPEGGPLATDGRRLYVLSNDGVGGCVAAALAPRSGDVLWRVELPTFAFAAPAVAGDVVLVPGADGALRGLDAATGRLRAEVPLGAPSACPPASAHGLVVVGTGAAPFLPGQELVCIGRDRR